MLRKRFWQRRGTYFLMSTVVTVNLTPFSHRTMKSLWQKGQLPTFSPSCPAWKKDSHWYYFSWPNTRSFPVAMAISGPLPTWQTSDFRGERRVPVRDYSLRHFPHQVELQAVTDASVCCHLSLGPLKSRPEFHVLILSYVMLIWLSCAKLRHHCVTLSSSDEIPQISAEVTSLSRVLMK